ncbi:hypothetical protein [Pelobacter seleniigenes]|uniref:hypothetical protein n=1 Tax=Pelobacter seleniigenes TaxID=407188 RepID=UPI0004A6F0F7|nr:hypothetical protein [Pelobacter seleniigenes]
MKAAACQMFSMFKIVLDGMNGGMYSFSIASAIHFKNTLQASPMVRRRDAQTGGFIFRGLSYAI